MPFGFTLNLGSLVVHLVGKSASFDAMAEKVDKGLENIEKKAGKLGKSLSLKVTAPIVGLAAVAVNSFGKFDEAMTKSTAIMTDVNPRMRKEMEKTALQLSTKSVQSATELAEGYFFLASAGLDAAQSIKSLPVVTRFATAGAFNLARATDLLTDAQSALGLTSKNANENMMNMTRLSDVLVKANTLANASVEEFSKSLTTKAAASLKVLNKDMEEGVAVLAAFADQGTKGELAGGRLSIVLRDLQSASLRNSDQWEKLGLRVFDVNGKMRGISDIMRDITTSLDPMSDKQKKMTLSLLGFQDRSVSAIQSLLGLSDKIDEYEKKLRNAGGTTQKVADEQLSAFNTQLKQTSNLLNTVAIDAGEAMAPKMLELNDIVASSAESFKGLNTEDKQFIIGLSLTVAAIGPLLVGLGAMAKGSRIVLAFFSAMSGVGVLVATALAMVSDWLNITDLGFQDFVRNLDIVRKTTDALFIGMMNSWVLFRDTFMNGVDFMASHLETVLVAALLSVVGIMESMVNVARKIPGFDKISGIDKSVFGNLEKVQKDLTERNFAAERNLGELALRREERAIESAKELQAIWDASVFGQDQESRVAQEKEIIATPKITPVIETQKESSQLSNIIDILEAQLREQQEANVLQ